MFRPEIAPFPSPLQRPEDQAEIAEAALYDLARASRFVGMSHAPDNLEHFLDGSGMDPELPYANVQARVSVKVGEQRNRDGIVSSLPRIGAVKKGGGTDETFPAHGDQLLRLADGETIMIEGSNEHDERMSFGGTNSPVSIDQEEQWASAKTTVHTTTSGGLTAVRRGDRSVVAPREIWKARWRLNEFDEFVDPQRLFHTISAAVAEDLFESRMRYSVITDAALDDSRVHRWRSNMRELPHPDECGFMQELIMKGGDSRRGEGGSTLPD